MTTDTVKTRIVILGGGFAGVEAARYLDRTAAKREDIEVTLVSRENFTVFTPMLHEVAAGDLEPAHICNPLRNLLRRVVVLTGSVESIDLAQKRVTISYSTSLIHRYLPFDYLLLALGADTNYAGVPGVAEHALGIKTLGDAVMLRAAVIALLETASVEPDPEQRKQMLTFVVAGGGFAGVETVGAINDLARESLPHYGRIDPGEVRVVLIHGGPFILPELGETLGRYTQKKLGERRVEIKLNCKVSSYENGAIQCSDGDRIPADTLVWAAGVSPSPILKTTGFELQKAASSSTLRWNFSGTSGNLGGGRLRRDSGSRHETAVSADGAARTPRRPPHRQKHLLTIARQTNKSFRLQRSRTARGHRTPHRSRSPLWIQRFRTGWLGAVAIDLPDEVAATGKEAARGHRVAAHCRLRA